MIPNRECWRESVLNVLERDSLVSAVLLPSPMAPPPPAVPSYRIPSTGEPAPPLVVTPITAREMDLDAKAVADACWSVAVSRPGFREWPDFLGAKASSRPYRRADASQ